MGLGVANGEASPAPRVVVSLKPIHSLVAGVMAGVGEPTLLLRGSASPHSYSLRPSDARALNEANLVFWVGGGLETFLERPLRALAGDADVVALSTVPGIGLLESRPGGARDARDEDGHESEAGHGKQDEAQTHRPGEYNLHIWLDPVNAIAIAEAAVTALSEVDPGHAADYARNGDALIVRLNALDRETQADLGPVKDTPFVVFHDAYHYFETHYELNAVGSITVSPDRAPGALRVSEIRKKIMELEAACVFSEPQFAPSLLETIVEGTAARRGILDPLGAAHPAGPEAYFSLMRGLAGSLKKCLALAS
jgi:zinc transport system substrate-binding protein